VWSWEVTGHGCLGCRMGFLMVWTWHPYLQLSNAVIYLLKEKTHEKIKTFTVCIKQRINIGGGRVSSMTMKHNESTK
jgi:hypothetical protein